MTGPGDQQDKPNDAWWQEQTPPPAQPYSQSDPTMVGQPGYAPPQGAGPAAPAPGQQPADPTILRQPFDQPGAAPAGYQQSMPGYPQPGHDPSAPAYQQPAPGHNQSSPGYPQPAPGYQQSSPEYPQPTAGQYPSSPGYPQAAHHQSAPGYPQPAPGFPQPGFDQQGFQQPTPGFQQPGSPQSAPGFQQPGFQQAAPGFPQPGSGFPQSGPPNSGGKGWLWAVGAVVLTSAIWAGSMFAIGAFDSGKADISKDADLRGYQAIDNLCDITDTSPYTSAGFTLSTADSSGETYPQHEAQKHAAVDSMGCSVRFKPSGSTEKYDYAAIYTNAEIHKQTNPGPEFTANYATLVQTKYGKDAKVDKVSGLGDEAYLVTTKQKSDDPTADVSLAVRDGWTTYHISWSQYASSSSKTSSKIVSATDAAAMLKKTATSTLGKLRK